MSFEIRENYKLVIFDRDNTLTEPKSGATFPKDASDWQWMLGHPQKVGQLCKQGVKVAVVTNQAGPLWREATGQEKYPSAQAIAEAMLRQLMECIQFTRNNILWCVSLYDQKAVDLINKSIDKEILAVSEIAGRSTDPQAAPEYETPDEILARLKDVFHKEIERFNVWVGINPSWRKPNPGMLDFAMSHYGAATEDTLMVGDRPEDQQAAEAAGTDFYWSWDFFQDGPIIV